MSRCHHRKLVKTRGRAVARGAAEATGGWRTRARPRLGVTLGLSRVAGGPQRPAPVSFLSNLPPQPKQTPRATHLPIPREPLLPQTPSALGPSLPEPRAPCLPRGPLRALDPVSSG